MTERNIMEAPAVEKSPPRVPYSEIFNNIDGHKNLTFDERVQVKAIDIMVDALRETARVDEDFPGMTLGDNSRLTDLNCPEYELDLLWGVHTPGEFLEKIIEFASEESKDSGLLKRWKGKMEEIASPGRDLPDEAKAKKVVRDFLSKEDSQLAITVGDASGSLW